MTDTLNWRSDNKTLIRGLKSKIKQSETLITGKTKFITVRLGMKYLDRLDPGTFVGISLSPYPGQPVIIGYAFVRSVRKTRLNLLEKSDWKLNIGAKTLRRAIKDMQSVYGADRVHGASIVTVIELES